MVKTPRRGGRDGEAQTLIAPLQGTRMSTGKLRTSPKATQLLNSRACFHYITCSFSSTLQSLETLTADSQVQGSGPIHFSLYTLLLLIMVMIPYSFTNSKYEMPVIFITSCGHCRFKDKGASSAYIQHLVFTYPCCFSLKKRNKKQTSHALLPQQSEFCCRCFFILDDIPHFYICLLLPKAYKLIKNYFKLSILRGVRADIG